MDQWLYQAGGIHIQSGFKMWASNGFIGVSTKHELVMYDNKGNEFLRTPVSSIESPKFSPVWGSRMTINGKKFGLEFKPYSAGGAVLGGALGAAIGSAMMKDKDDPRSEKEKREQFAALIEQIQSGQIHPAG